MGTRDPLDEALRLAAFLVALCLMACGGGPKAADADGGYADASRVPTLPVHMGLADATTCSDACGDATAGAADASEASPGSDAGEAGDVPDAGNAADAADAASGDDAIDAYVYDGPPITNNEVCHVAWLQPAAFSGSGDSFRLVVDPSGNTYVAISYASDPPISFGVPSPGNPVGIAIAKVDPQCRLVWMREIGAPPGTTGTEINFGIAVDSTSSLTLAGVFIGTVDFGAGPPATGYQVGYVVRLDSAGNVVFHHESPGAFPSIVGVGADGSATLLFYDYFAWECSVSPTFTGCDAGPVAEAGSNFYSLVRLSATGSEVARNSFPGSPGISGLGPATFTFLSLDPTGTIWAVDNYTDSGSAVERLLPTGVPLWSQPAAAVNLVLGPAGGVTLNTSNSGPLTETFTAIGYDGGVAWMRATTLPSTAPYPQDIAVDPTGAIYAGGQLPFPAVPQGAPLPNGGVGVQALDSEGGLQAVRVWPSGGDETYRSFGIDLNGNAIVGGSLNTDAGEAYFVVKLGR